HALGAREFGRSANSALFDTGNLGRYADYNRRLRREQAHEGPARVHRLLDEVAEHRCRDIEVCDHPIAQRADCTNRTRGPAQHLAGTLADSERAMRSLILGNDGGLPYDDTFAFDV